MFDDKEIKIKFKKEVYAKLFLVLFLFAFCCFLFLNKTHIILGLNRILNILKPFFIGAALAFIIKIPMNFIERKLFAKIHYKKFEKFKRPLSLLISFILIFCVMSFLITLIVPQLVSSFLDLQYKVPQFIQTMLDKMEEIKPLRKYALEYREIFNNITWRQVFDQAQSYLDLGKNWKSITNTAFTTAFTTATTIFGTLFNLIFSIMAAIYILLSKEKLAYQSKRILYSITKIHTADKISHVFELLHDNLFGFIRGQLTDSFILGVLIFIGCIIMKMPNSSMLAVLIGVTNVVPIVGPFIGAILGFILIVIEDPTKAIMFVIFVIIMQQFESNVIYPKVVGGALGLPALWTLVAITLGGSLFGVVGMWLFIPLASTIYTLIAEYTQFKIMKKGIDMKKVMHPTDRHLK